MVLSTLTLAYPVETFVRNPRDLKSGIDGAEDIFSTLGAIFRAIQQVIRLITNVTE